MKKFLLIVFAGSIVLGACKKKTYQCECKNSQATYVAGEVEAKSTWGAKRKCKALSGDATKCSVK